MEQSNVSTSETFYKYIHEVFTSLGINRFVTTLIEFITSIWQRGDRIAGPTCDFCSPLGTCRRISPSEENPEEIREEEIEGGNFNRGSSVVTMIVRRTMTNKIDGVSFIVGFLTAIALALVYLLVKMVVTKICRKIKESAREFINSCIQSHRVNVLSRYAAEKRDSQDL